MANQTGTIIASALEVTYHPSPPGLPHGIGFHLFEQNGDRTVYFLPCLGTGPADIEPTFKELQKVLNRLFKRSLNS